MRIGVLADTHIPEAGPDLPAEAYLALEGCDQLIHCGDLHAIEVLDRLGEIAPVLASRGNGDPLTSVGPPEYRPGVPEDPRVAVTRVIEVEGFRIGLTHDLEAAEGRPAGEVDALLLRIFGTGVEIALCGHTHVPMVWGLESGTAILNPGSPTLPYGYTHLIGTIGYLDVEPGRFEFTVIDLGTGEVELSLIGPGRTPLTRGPRPALQGSRI